MQRHQYTVIGTLVSNNFSDSQMDIRHKFTLELIRSLQIIELSGKANNLVASRLGIKLIQALLKAETLMSDKITKVCHDMRRRLYITPKFHLIGLNDRFLFGVCLFLIVKSRRHQVG